MRHLWSGFALAVYATAITINENYTMCSWGRLRAGVIRDILYLDGGELWWQKTFVDGTTSDPTSDGNVEGDMYLLNFSQPFNTGSTNLSNLFTAKQKAGGAANNLAPNYIDGTMFANNDELYLYGCADFPNSSPVLTIGSGLTLSTNASSASNSNEVLGYEVYQYGPDRQSWAPGFYEGTLPTEVSQYITNGAGVTAASENLGFYFSGMRASDWGPIFYNTDFADTPANSLIEIDMSTMRSEKWTNSSLPSSITPRANAELVWLPVSDQGVLVAIGGVTAPEEIWPYGLNSSQKAESKSASPGFMTSIPVYDIASKQWFVQKTSGTPPGQLTEFCSVYAAANDSSSFSIYIYGGYDGLNADYLPSDDVWILSVPSFQWVKAYSGQTSHGRSGHKCVAPYPDQMFVVGGVHQSQAFCVDGIIQVFDLNNLQFQDSYTPTVWAPYQVPNVLTSVIGGNAQGGATKTATWSDANLSKVFQTKYTGAIQNYYPYPLTSNTASTGSVSHSSSNRWLAPVLGTVLGLLVIGIILFGILLARRRKLLRRNNSVSTSSTSTSRYMRWVNGIPPDVQEGKSEPSISSSEAAEHPSHRSNLSSGTNPTTPLTSELGGRPRYEMNAAPLTQPARPPVELPTPYHDESHYSYPRNIDYAYDQPVRAGEATSTPSGYESDSSPFSPDHVNRDSAISHGGKSEVSPLPSNSNSPLLAPSRMSRAEDDIPPVPAIGRHSRQVSTMSSGLVSPLTPVDEGKRFRFE